MKTLGNIIWVLFGGIFIAIEYLLGSVALMVTIIGIPFGLQSLKLAELALWPFGRKVKQRESASGCLSVLMNVIWFFVRNTHRIDTSPFRHPLLHHHHRHPFWEPALQADEAGVYSFRQRDCEALSMSLNRIIQ